MHHKWLSEIDKNGVKSDMSDIFDEAAIRALKPDQLTGVIRTPTATNPNQ